VFLILNQYCEPIRQKSFFDNIGLKQTPAATGRSRGRQCRALRFAEPEKPLINQPLNFDE
jgi:hypothetical protein